MARKFTRLATASYRRRVASIALVCCLTAGALVASSAIGRSTGTSLPGSTGLGFSGIFGTGNPPAVARDYTYTTPDTGSLAVGPVSGVLSQDGGGPLQLTTYTQPQHGAVTVQPNGSFQYTPFAGYAGTDSFTYTVSNAVHLYSDHLPPLGTVGGVDLNAGGYGSSMYPDPGHPGFFYGLEDRGPNVSSSNSAISSSIDVEPLPTYDPSIGLFRFIGATPSSSARSR